MKSESILAQYLIVLSCSTVSLDKVQSSVSAKRTAEPDMEWASRNGTCLWKSWEVGENDRYVNSVLFVCHNERKCQTNSVCVCVGGGGGDSEQNREQKSSLCERMSNATTWKPRWSRVTSARTVMRRDARTCPMSTVRPALIVIWIPRRILACLFAEGTCSPIISSTKQAKHNPFHRARPACDLSSTLATRLSEKIVWVWPLRTFLISMPLSCKKKKKQLSGRTRKQTNKKLIPTFFSKKKGKRPKKKVGRKVSKMKQKKKKKKKGALGVEPRTSWSAVKCSTTELYARPQITWEAKTVFLLHEHQKQYMQFFRRILASGRASCHSTSKENKREWASSCVHKQKTTKTERSCKMSIQLHGRVRLRIDIDPNAYDTKVYAYSCSRWAHAFTRTQFLFSVLFLLGGGGGVPKFLKTAKTSRFLNSLFCLYFSQHVRTNEEEEDHSTTRWCLPTSTSWPCSGPTCVALWSSDPNICLPSTCQCSCQTAFLDEEASLLMYLQEPPCGDGASSSVKFLLLLPLSWPGSKQGLWQACLDWAQPPSCPYWPEQKTKKANKFCKNKRKRKTG